METNNMNGNSSNEIPEIKVENAIEEKLLNKFNNLSLRDPKNDILFKIIKRSKKRYFI